MKDTMCRIDPATWDRAKIFESYKEADLPYIFVTADLDVTNLYCYVKEQGVSFHFAFLYLAAKAANTIPNFHYRIIDGEVWWVEELVAVTTHLTKGSEHFIMSECLPYSDLVTYARENHAAAEAIKPGGNPRGIESRNDILNCSAIPWISYTSFVRTIAHSGQDSNPKLTLGKYHWVQDRLLLPFSTQTHHGLMDGLHVGRFYERIQEMIDEKMWG